MHQEMSSPDATQLWYPLVRAALRRIPGMAAVWAGFGVACGVLAAPGAGPIAIAAGVTAGMIVLVPFGIALAIAGGKWRDSLVGGLLALALVPLVAGIGAPSGASLVPVALVFGGIVGATVVTAMYRLPRVVFGLARRAYASGERVEKPVAV